MIEKPIFLWTFEPDESKIFLASSLSCYSSFALLTPIVDSWVGTRLALNASRVGLSIDPKSFHFDTSSFGAKVIALVAMNVDTTCLIYVYLAGEDVHFIDRERISEPRFACSKSTQDFQPLITLWKPMQRTNITTPTRVQFKRISNRTTI